MSVFISAQPRSGRFAVSTNSIGSAALVREPPSSVGGEDRLDVVVGIRDAISCAPIADLKVEHVGLGALYQVMRVAGPAAKTRAHPRPQPGLAGIGDQAGLPVEDVDELVLFAVGVAKR